MKSEMRQKLLNLHTRLRFDRLIAYIEYQRIPIVDCKLHDCYGLAIDKGIFIDVDKILSYEGPDTVYFTILHETAHYKHMQRVGKDTIVKLLAEPDFDKFADDVIREEIIADRYASRLYLRMNGEPISAYRTQRLELPSVQEVYKAKVLPQLYNKVRSEEDYDNLWVKFIAND